MTQEEMEREETEREETLAIPAREIRAPMLTPRSEFVDQDQAFSAARGAIETARSE